MVDGKVSARSILQWSGGRVADLSHKEHSSLIILIDPDFKRFGSNLPLLTVALTPIYEEK